MKSTSENSTQAARKQRGFTLIELLVVFAIVALLSSIAVPILFQSSKITRVGSSIRFVCDEGVD